MCGDFRMIDVTLSPRCMALIRRCGLAPAVVEKAVNDRHRGCVDDGFSRIIAAHWLSDEQVVLIDSTVSKRTIEGSTVHFDEVMVQLAVLLPSKLPSGVISCNMTMGEILVHVAEVYGVPVRCHPDHSFASLYTGPWDGKAVELQPDPIRNSDLIFIVGSFNQQVLNCELVWAFDLGRYRPFLSEPLTRTRLPIADLLAFANAFRAQYPSIPPSTEWIQLAVAAQILRTFLGDIWCDLQLRGRDEAHPRFQRSPDLFQQSRTQAWIVALGELLFNLQDIPGFDKRCQRLIGDDLESVVAELEAVRLLAESCLPVELVEEVGVRGSDYDARVTLPTGEIASCEVKSKAEGTTLSTRTLLGQLKDGAKRLPPDRPGILILRLPEHWVCDGETLSRVVESVTGKLFHDYGRIIALILFWDEWQFDGQQVLLRMMKFREYVNRDSRFFKTGNKHLILTYDEGSFMHSWQTLASLAGKVLQAQA